MAEMRGLGANGTFSMTKVLTGHVLFVGPFRVYCDFGDDDDEQFGGSGRFTIFDEDNSHVEFYGSVRQLAPLLRQVADAFEARLAQLP